MTGDLRSALKREMERTGLRGKRLSRKAGLNPDAVRDLLGKISDPRVSTLRKISNALNVPASFLLNEFVPVIGTVTVGGRVKLDDPPDPQLVPRPPVVLEPGEELVAIRVDGETLRPLHRDGDVLFFSRRKDASPIEFDYLGDEVVAQIDGGANYLRTLMAGTGERHTLRQEFGGLDDENVKLAWASPILFKTARRALPKEPNGTPLTASHGGFLLGAGPSPSRGKRPSKKGNGAV